MSRQRRTKHLDRLKKEQAQQQPKKSILLKVLGSLLSLILAIAGIYISIVPRPTVSPEGPSDPTQPFSVLVTIINSNVVPLKNVSATLEIIEISTRPTQLRPYPHPDYGHTIGLTKPDWKWDSLTMDERLTINLGELINLGPGAHLGGADVAVRIDYQPWFVPIHRTKRFRFVARTQPDGTMRLFSTSL